MRTDRNKTTKAQQRLPAGVIDVFAFGKPLLPRFCNIAKEVVDRPWARGGRCLLEVTEVENGYEAPLPGVEGVVIHALDTYYMRCLTSLDISLLCTLSALISMHNKGLSVRVGSYKALLSMLGYGYNTDNRNALKDTLDYLQNVCFIIRHSGRKYTLTPPLLVSMDAGALLLTMTEKFHKFFTGKDSNKPPARVPLPLPKEFAAQNLMMWVASTNWSIVYAEGNEVDELRYPTIKRVGKDRAPIELSVLANQIGLDHSTKYRDLRRAMEVVQEAYLKLKRGLVFQEASGKTLAEVRGYENAGPAFKRTKFVRLVSLAPPVWKRTRKPRGKATLVAA